MLLAVTPGVVVTCVLPGFWHTVGVEFVFVHSPAPAATADTANPANETAAKAVPT
jgi:hypothetical protein